MISKERLEELIKEEAIVYGVYREYDDYGYYDNIIEEQDLSERYYIDFYEKYGITGILDDLKNTYDNLFETKDEAEFYAEFGNVEKVIKMPVPPTWEEQSKIKGYGYFDIIKLGHLTLKRLLPISKIKGKFFVEKAYSKDFYTFEYTKQGYIKALRKMVELWREEV